jgi:hypothetical protein
MPPFLTSPQAQYGDPGVAMPVGSAAHAARDCRGHCGIAVFCLQASPADLFGRLPSCERKKKARRKRRAKVLEVSPIEEET